MPSATTTNSRRHSQAGQSLVGVAFVSVLLLALGAAGVDAVLVHVVQTHLSTAADAASMAGARALADGASSQEQTAEINRAAALRMKTNLPDGLVFSGPTGPVDSAIRVASPNQLESDSPMFEADPGLDADVREVRVSLQTTAPTFFARLLGFPAVSVSASAVAERRLDQVALLPERSTPKGNAFAWADWQEAAAEFMRRFDAEAEKVDFAALGALGNVAPPTR